MINPREPYFVGKGKQLSVIQDRFGCQKENNKIQNTQ
jgi:hypothetical protein